MNMCDYYESSRCLGTKEMDFVNCSGDKTKCSVYPEKKKDAEDHARTMSIINDIVDKAIRAGDRWVSIYCGDSGVSVNVYPLYEEGEDE